MQFKQFYAFNYRRLSVEIKMYHSCGICHAICWCGWTNSWRSPNVNYYNARL